MSATNTPKGHRKSEWSEVLEAKGSKSLNLPLRSGCWDLLFSRLTVEVFEQFLAHELERDTHGLNQEDI